MRVFCFIDVGGGTLAVEAAGGSLIVISALTRTQSSIACAVSAYCIKLSQCAGAR